MRPVNTPIARPVSLLVMLLWATAIQAQPTPPDSQIVLQATDHLTLFQVDAAEHLTLLTDLPNTISILNSSNVEWDIPSWREIAVSPNRQYVAFTALRSITGEGALFIYDIRQRSLKQITVPGYGYIHWSPASDGLAVEPTNDDLVEGIRLDSVFLYDLLSDTLSPLDRSSGPVVWLPDSQHIVYTGPVADCDAPCVDVRNLYLTDRSGENSTILTELQTQIMASASTAYVYCSPRKIMWNDEQQRIFYSLHCIDTSERYLDLLYSVSLNLDNRLEGSLASQFPQDTYSVILDFFPVGNAVYIVVDGFSQPSLGSTESAYAAGRVLRLDTPGSLMVMIERSFDINLSRNLTRAEISPNQRSLAIIGYDVGYNKTGYLVVVDLPAGRLTSEEQQTPNQICSLAWVDSQKLLFTEFPESQCNPYQQPGNTILYDTQTGNAQVINTPGQAVWLLPS